MLFLLVVFAIVLIPLIGPVRCKHSPSVRRLLAFGPSVLPLFFWLPDALHGGEFGFLGLLFLGFLFTLSIAIGLFGLALAALWRRGERRAAAAV